MHLIIIVLGVLGILGFGMSVISLFIYWVYLVLKITHNYSPSIEQDRMVAKLSILSLKIFLFSIAYMFMLVFLVNLFGRSK